MRIYAYFHAGSKNHGCEAIVRTTQELLKDKIRLLSFVPDEDKIYGIDKLVSLGKLEGRAYTIFDKIICILSERVANTEKLSYYARARHEAASFSQESIALAIGGDNYCYGDAYNFHLSGLNYYLHKRKVKTVLWGCSIEPEQITDSMKRDFSRYDLIVARESISYKVLKSYNPNTILACDPAFNLETKYLPLPDKFIPDKTVGINLSPLIQKSENEKGITLLNYRMMIRHIIETTDYNIALIPHVVCEGNDDRQPLTLLFREFEKSGRICMIDDCDCMQLKGYIARCSLFVGARTHATIAAYASAVPTLVIGYSTKAKGIARDLFGSEEHYVLPVQHLKQQDDMEKAFDWLNLNKKQITEHLQKIMPEYSSTIKKVVEKVQDLERGKE